MLSRRIAAAVCAPVLLLLSVPPPAMAASGHITDPSGELPDILRLNYSNAPGKVVMTLKFANVADAQNRGFWIQWGEPQKYQVFDSPSAAIASRWRASSSRCGCERNDARRAASSKAVLMDTSWR